MSSTCENCGKVAILHKVKCADDTGIGSMNVCQVCQDNSDEGNPGCDKCGMGDRAEGSTWCEACLIDAGMLQR